VIYWCVVKAVSIAAMQLSLIMYRQGFKVRVPTESVPLKLALKGCDKMEWLNCFALAPWHSDC